METKDCSPIASTDVPSIRVICVEREDICYQY